MKKKHAMKNEICMLLRKKSKIIMSRWEKRANKELFAEQDETSLVLQDSLPEYLNQMADALSKSIVRSSARNKSDKKESLRIGVKHGHERTLFSNYSINQLISEFHILREIIFEVLEENSDPLPIAARDIILNSIEQIVNDAATEFSESARNFQEHFSLTVTHDLRTPIAAAKMSAQLILREKDAPEVVNNLASRVVHNMNRVDAMIRDLLDSSRLRAGKKLELPVEDLDLNELITSVCTDLNALYDNRIKFISGKSVPGRWSKQGLWRVIENLSTNAVKYGAKKKDITVKLVKNRKKVHCTVHNFGKPIPQNKKSSMFDEFTRNQKMKTKDGWGIGLSVVKGIVEAHKGKVWIESTKAKGTTFHIELPTIS